VAKINKNIYLIGMPGVGKSYWAEQIAAAQGLQCIDIDDMIAVRSGMSIANFFERFGEEAFRQLERLTLSQIQEVFPHNCVVACGGGTACYADNLSLMKAKGTVIYLKATLPFLEQNLSKESQKRPLLQSENWQIKLSEMLDLRKSYYEQADFIVSAESLNLKYFQTIMQAFG
jgi:shikimate kinase